MSDDEEKDLVRVRDVMKTEFDMVDGLATVADALREMKYIDSKALIVRKRNDDDEYGIVELEDIATDVLARNRAPERVNIYEIMNKPLIGIDPDMDIRYCARMFERYQLNRAAVVEAREVIGIVSYADIVIKGMKRLLA
ncbi:MAG: CBS domain-containing protein [Chromatiaceae bacterium]|nr:CBS domain-containing protein [Gammaproteobacteria bacterium]MCP5301453.1 CBS domain-containing protein [Chromatiaceae bacterium]MCP5423017.1 CBS domain-containing protein [Chromatiaceae bacterium]